MNNDTPLKTCRKCGKELPATLEYFGPSKKAKSGLRHQCRDCQRAYFRKYNAEYTKRDYVKEYRREQQHSETRKQWHYERNRDSEYIARRRAYMREYLSDPVNRQRQRESVRSSKAAIRATPEGKERTNATQRRYNRTQKAKEVECRRQQNPEERKKRREREARRRKRPEVQEQLKSYRVSEHGRMKHRIASHIRRARMRSNGGTYTKQDIEKLYELQKGRCWYCEVVLGQHYHIEHRVPISRGGSNELNNIVLACPHCNQTKANKLPSEWSDRLL